MSGPRSLDLKQKKLARNREFKMFAPELRLEPDQNDKNLNPGLSCGLMMFSSIAQAIVIDIWEEPKVNYLILINNIIPEMIEISGGFRSANTKLNFLIETGPYKPKK